MIIKKKNKNILYQFVSENNWFRHICDFINFDDASCLFLSAHWEKWFDSPQQNISDKLHFDKTN